MAKGTIKTLFANRGFGFIKSEDQSPDCFFHLDFLAQGVRFSDLREGDAVEFNLRPSKKKPGQQEAYDIRLITQVDQTQRGNTPVPKDQSTVLPYGFMPVNVNHAVTDTPIWHDASSEGELLSGEILCELEALTPLLPGNMRYPVEEANQERLQQWGFGELKEKKQIAEPLRLPDGRVLIAGSSLKGMIRHSLSALTSAPMERVGERHFTYRPNLDFNNVKEKYVVRPARVLKSSNGGWDIEVFNNARAALFVCSDAVQYIENVANNGIVLGVVNDVKIERSRIISKTDDQSNFNHRIVRYKGGIDGEGLLAQAFNNKLTYKHALVPKIGDYKHLDADLYQKYLNDQNNILADEKIGHLNAHPLKKSLETNQVSIDQVSQAIRKNAKFSPGQLIYVELTTDQKGKVSKNSKVVSCGHHFRYRWAYTSSVRKQNGQTRNCLTPLDVEKVSASQENSVDVAPERLTGARLLFGYVRDEETNPVGKGVFERLAGRIAINHAVSDGRPRFLGDLNQGYCIPLKILGQSKSSAWEFSLQQPDNDQEPLKTYGDLPDDLGGDLAGLKFYRQQQNTNQNHIKASDTENINSDQATLARFICQPGIRFRFTIRFARLRAWELGALLAVIEPKHLSNTTEQQYAHKLGLGRPLGMGSVSIQRKAIRIRLEQTLDFLDAMACTAKVDEALKAVDSKISDQVREQWLAVHQIHPQQSLDYPRKTGKDGETIYNWHSDVRKKYSKLRRQQDPDWGELKCELRAINPAFKSI